MTVVKIELADEATLSGPTQSILRKRCAIVQDIDDRVGKAVDDLRDTLRSDTLSVGLAAPQIGYDLAVAIVNLDKKNNPDDLVMINPVISSETGKWDSKYESCMSIPHKKGQVKRRNNVVITYRDLCGKTQERKATGFEARVLLHEIDHLNGILFVDRMEEDAELEDTELFREHGIA